MTSSVFVFGAERILSSTNADGVQVKLKVGGVQQLTTMILECLECVECCECFYDLNATYSI